MVQRLEANGCGVPDRRVIFELIWRDFFKFFSVKHGNGIFLETGTSGEVDASLLGGEVCVAQPACSTAVLHICVGRCACSTSPLVM